MAPGVLDTSLGALGATCQGRWSADTRRDEAPYPPAPPSATVTSMDPASPTGSSIGNLVDRLVSRRELVTMTAPKLPWDEPGFSARMLREHLDQHHDRASRQRRTIDIHVEWIFQTVLGGRPGGVLDLGCGPGLYTERLAALGCACTGVDISPASIDHARRVADERDLPCSYVLGDIRTVDLGAGHDLAICVFGELNTFARSDVVGILRRVARSLRPGGALLLEAHTYDSVVAEGVRGTGWYTATTGLFSDRPHLVLYEHAWDETAARALTRYHVLDDAGAVGEHAEVLYAYTEDEYRQLLVAAGFDSTSFATGMGSTHDPDMVVITAERADRHA